VEVTSRCTRQCAVCPRTALTSVWIDGDLGDAAWAVLRRDLGLARHVHLQGWGEPLLHPRLPEMAAAAKAAGSTVGVTTNGDLLADAVDWIVAGRIDLVTVSVAGDATTHAALRSGSRLERIWEAVERLAARRGKRRQPAIKVSYLLTAANPGSLPGVVRAAADTGADELFVTHVDCTPSPELLGMAAFDGPRLRPEVGEAITAAARVAGAAGIGFRPPALAEQEPLVCASDPLRFAFVARDGRVGPCVNLLLPVRGPIPRWGEDGVTQVEPVVFGDLARNGLGEILGGGRYRRFAASFASRLAIEGRFLDGVVGERGTRALVALDEADRRREADLAANPFPEPCRSCHKAAGW
jgi:MoaA/NifB/PqqE/SkfB family radical SAM enzyme